jgi:hypothetical protein
MHPEALNILLEAALLARSSGVLVIGLDELLAVTAQDYASIQAGTPSVAGPQQPVPKFDISLSPAAADAFARAGALDGFSGERLRNLILGEHGLGRANG